MLLLLLLLVLATAACIFCGLWLADGKLTRLAERKTEAERARADRYATQLAQAENKRTDLANQLYAMRLCRNAEKAKYEEAAGLVKHLGDKLEAVRLCNRELAKAYRGTLAENARLSKDQWAWLRPTEQDTPRLYRPSGAR